MGMCFYEGELNIQKLPVQISLDLEKKLRDNNLSWFCADWITYTIIMIVSVINIVYCLIVVGKILINKLWPHL